MKRIYLDVDGVINAFSSKPPRQNTGWLGRWHEDVVDSFRVFWSEELIAELNRLALHPDVEIVWATDWRSAAPELLGPAIGLHEPRWAFLDAPDDRLRVYQPWWKLEEIEKHYFNTETERAVWIDDNIWSAKGIREWTTRLGTGFSTLNTNSHHGMTRKDVKFVENLLRLTPEED